MDIIENVELNVIFSPGFTVSCSSVEKKNR